MDKEEILHIVVESLPETAPLWVDVLSALLMPTIALGAAYVAYQQHKVNKQRLMHETYDKRLKVYKTVQKHLTIIIRARDTTFAECLEFYSEASEAAFLFDKSVINRIDKMYNKSVQMVALRERLYPDDGSQGLPGGEERNEVSQQITDLYEWHVHQLEASKVFFAEKLGLKH